MSRNKCIAALAALSLCVFASPAARADGLQEAIAHDFAGWKVYQQVAGDLNGDGTADVAAILSKRAEGTDENGQALLVVYMKDGKGSYKLRTKASKAICVGCGGPKAAMGEPLGELSIGNGLLVITYQGGSREAFDDQLKWRLDKRRNKFFLVGETRKVTDTLGDEPEEVLDVNYSTLKLSKRVGKKKTTCAVSPVFKAIELSAFDYDGKHVDDLENIGDSCNRG